MIDKLDGLSRFGHHVRYSISPFQIVIRLFVSLGSSIGIGRRGAIVVIDFDEAELRWVGSVLQDVKSGNARFERRLTRIFQGRLAKIVFGTGLASHKDMD